MISAFGIWKISFVDIFFRSKMQRIFKDIYLSLESDKLLQIAIDFVNLKTMLEIQTSFSQTLKLNDFQVFLN